MFGETLPLPFGLLQVFLDRQDCASLFHQRCAFRIFRPIIPQEDCSSVPVMFQLLHVSLIFSQSFPRAGHGKQHCPHALHSSCSQQDISWCRTLFSHSVFISPSTDCIRNVFLLLLWRSDLFCSPKDSLTLFHRTIPELFIHVFWISGSSTIWLALQYPWRVWFPPGRLCLWAVFRKFPSTSSFSGLGNSFHTQSPSYSNCLCCSALLLLILSCASVCFCSSWHWITPSLISVLPPICHSCLSRKFTLKLHNHSRNMAFTWHHAHKYYMKKDIKLVGIAYAETWCINNSQNDPSSTWEIRDSVAVTNSIWIMLQTSGSERFLW